MARYQAYRCPDCNGKFRHLHHLDDDLPDRCPLCRSWMSEDEPPEPAFVPQAPGIRKSAYARAVDQSYRAMEDQSIGRAEEAADLLGQAYRDDNRNAPPEGDGRVLAELQKHQIDELKSGLKITNMKDPSSMREGDTAAIMPAIDPKSEVARGARFQMAGGGAPDFAPGVGGGTQAMQTIRNVTSGNHFTKAAQMTRAGNLGRYRE